MRAVYVGVDRDSEHRQRAAIQAFRAALEIFDGDLPSVALSGPDHAPCSLQKCLCRYGRALGQGDDLASPNSVGLETSWAYADATRCSIDGISLLCLACGQQQSPEDAMRLFKIALMAVGAVALLGPLGPVAAFDAKEVGSFHIGGQALTLQGLPVKELVYTAGGPQTKMDPNGDFQTGQLYV